MIFCIKRFCITKSTTFLVGIKSCTKYWITFKFLQNRQTLRIVSWFLTNLFFRRRFFTIIIYKYSGMWITLHRLHEWLYPNFQKSWNTILEKFLVSIQWQNILQFLFPVALRFCNINSKIKILDITYAVYLCWEGFIWFFHLGVVNHESQSSARVCFIDAKHARNIFVSCQICHFFEILFVLTA